MITLASREQKGMPEMGHLALLLSMLRCRALAVCAEARSLVVTLVLPRVLHLSGAAFLPMDAWHSVSQAATAFVLLCCHRR